MTNARKSLRLLPIDVGIAAAILIQVATASIMLFILFGFDHRSTWGLDFDHFVIVAVTFLIALGYGMVRAFLRGRLGYIAIQLAAPLVIAIVRAIASLLL